MYPNPNMTQIKTIKAFKIFIYIKKTVCIDFLEFLFILLVVIFNINVIGYISSTLLTFSLVLIVGGWVHPNGTVIFVFSSLLSSHADGLSLIWHVIHTQLLISQSNPQKISEATMSMTDDLT